MKKLLIVVVLAGLLAGCGSPLIDTWADRGIQGVSYGQQNILEFQDRLQDVLQDRKERDIDGIFLDILRVSRGEIADTVIDEKWIEEHKGAFKLLLKLWEADQQNLDEATADAIENLDSIVETFEQIKRLRRAWGDVDQLQVQVDRLTGLVQQLISKGK